MTVVLNKSKSAWAVLGLAFSVCLPGLTARTQENVVPSSGVLSMTLQRPDSTYATKSTASAPEAPFRSALRVSVLRVPENPWNIQLNVPTVAAVARDDVLLATFYLKREDSTSDEALGTFIFEKAGPDWNKSAERTQVEGNDEWQKFHVAFKAINDYAAGAAQVNFQLGYEPQTLLLGGLSVTNYAKTVAIEDLPNDFTYAGRAPDASWRAPAEARINLHRKAEIQVRVLNPYGQVIPDAAVHARMTQHDFGFGSAVAAGALFRTDNHGNRYRQVITNLFNRVVMENDLKWPWWDSNPHPGINAVNWLIGRGIEVRGHTLIWPDWKHAPADVRNLENDPPALRQRINEHFADEVGTLRGKIVEWDVVNEPWNNHEIIDVLGQREMVEWFHQARASDPDARLFLNEFGNLEVPSRFDSHYQANLVNIDYLIRSGAPIGGFGMQSHFGAFLTSPSEIITRLEEHAELGVALAITEFDINTDNEEVQADYTRDLLTAAFSHPAVNAVIMWGFWEGAHWKPNAALFRYDWTMKPNAIAWSNQVHRVWSTDVEGRTSLQGTFGLRGFKGDYAITASVGDSTATESHQVVTNTSIDLVIADLPPSLAISKLDATVQLAWPAAATAFSLESSLLATPDVWDPVPNTPDQVDGFKILNVPIEDSAYLYRLRD